MRSQIASFLSLSPSFLTHMFVCFSMCTRTILYSADIVLAGKMVKLHVKKGDESQFLYETTVDVSTSELIDSLVAIYNGRLKVQRIAAGCKNNDLSLASDLKLQY